ncbi:hypothetical protein SO802_019630 [Lithocarpus litseifolius]|uniref:Uncharacterized protein n=1 Tax=Lithocarpus litseifolius TaxID=425828 RepID=A0AAW2CR89_9ROSI
MVAFLKELHHHFLPKQKQRAKVTRCERARLGDFGMPKFAASIKPIPIPKLADAPRSPSPLWFILFGQLLLDRKRRMKNNSFIIIIMLGVVVALMAALLFRLKSFTVEEEEEEEDLGLFTVEELALYNGTHPDLPILLGILG